MKKLLLIFLCLFAVTAYAQADLPSKNKHYERVKQVTRLQANELQLNEPDFIKLLRVNEKTLPLIFDAATEPEMIALMDVYQVRLTYVLNPEQIALISSKMDVLQAKQ